MTQVALGGDPPCWAHVVEFARRDVEDRHDLERLVRDFYRQAAMDDVLGPVFAGSHVDWAAHIPKLTDFWAWQLFGERGYTGNPLRAHEPAHARTSFGNEHYDRWLELFESTLDEGFAGPNAERLRGRARRMARALRRLLDGRSASGEVAVAATWTHAPASKSPTA